MRRLVVLVCLALTPWLALAAPLPPAADAADARVPAPGPTYRSAFPDAPRTVESGRDDWREANARVAGGTGEHAGHPGHGTAPADPPASHPHHDHGAAQ